VVGIAERVSTAVGAPVIDGVAAATVFAELLVTLGLRTSKHDEYAAPPPKPYNGPLAGFGLGYANEWADGIQGRAEVLPEAGA
jgi:allantoin racemase